MTNYTIQVQRTKLIPFDIMKTLPVYQQCLANQVRIFLHDTDESYGSYRGGSTPETKQFLETLGSALHDTKGLVSYFENCTVSEDGDDDGDQQYQFAAQFYGFNLDPPDYDKDYRIIFFFFEYECDLNKFIANDLLIAKLSL